MLNTLQHTLRRLAKSSLFIAGITALTCLLLSAYLLQQHNQQQLQERSAHYGQALANLAASQATDATLNHDLVSLQVTVSDVARNADILSVTIHDVENTLLVQSGNSPTAGSYIERDYRSFTAPITLHDSIAGYVTVTLDQASGDASPSRWLLALLGLALAMIVTSLFNLRHLEATEPNDQDASSANSLANAPSTTSSTDNSVEPSSADSVQVCLSLYCVNHAQLKQQLSASLRGQLFSQLEVQLNGVWALYGGKISFANEQGMELQFLGDDVGSTCFRALCAGKLILDLLKDDPDSAIDLEFRAALYSKAKGVGLQAQLQQAKQRQETWRLLQNLGQERTHNYLLLDGQQCATSQTLQRVQVQSTLVEERWFVVQAFQPSYQKLLDKQLAQLKRATRPLAEA